MSNIDVDETIGPKPEKAKTLISNMWNFLVKIGVGKDGKDKYKCKAYGKEYNCAGKSRLLTYHVMFLNCA